MRYTVRDKTRGRLAELDTLGTVDESVYAFPFVNPDGDMTGDQLIAQQKRETQSGRWQVMAARHWFQMTLQAETEEEASRLFNKAEALYWEAMYNAKGKLARLTKLPAKGGRPIDEAKELLYLTAIEIRKAEGCNIIDSLRRARQRNEFLKVRYAGTSDKGLRSIFDKERRKHSPKPPGESV